MRRFAITLLLLMLLPGFWLARGAVSPLVPSPAQTEPGAPAIPPPSHFLAADVYLNSGPRRLGSYQLEVTTKDAAIVGLEGGADPAFSAPPFYDPAALQGNRIVVAAFSTDDKLPAGDTRVARLHFLATGNPDPATNLPAMTGKLVIATDENGATIDAQLTLRPFQGDNP